MELVTTQDWENFFRQVTRDTIQYFEDKFNNMKKHPLIEQERGDRKRVLANRISKSWKVYEKYTDWETFVRISTEVLEIENEEYNETSLTENIEAYIHFQLLDMGVEVTKIRNGFKVNTKNADKHIRDVVMNLIINHGLLNKDTVNGIKFIIYTSIA